MFCFDLFSMKLSRSHDTSHKFDGYLDLIFLVHFFKLIYFFNFIFQLGIKLYIYFGLFSIRLYRSHDLSHMFGGITRVDSGYFLFLF